MGVIYFRNCLDKRESFGLNKGFDSNFRRLNFANNNDIFSRKSLTGATTHWIFNTVNI